MNPDFFHFQIGDLVERRNHPYYYNPQEGLGIVVDTSVQSIGATFDHAKQGATYKKIQFVEVYWQSSSQYQTLEVPNYLLKLVHRDEEITDEKRNS